jgi:c-di-AMP phosphodiesterase-like protein
MEMNELISSNEKITEEMIIACGDDDKVYDSVTNAKAADTILSLNGVEATFVISRRNHETVGISARSKGKVNVQVLMEKLGGGGHFNNAAVQMKEITTSAAKAKLVEAIELKKDDIYNKN